MILKSIEMQGFKSFADKIYLDFNSGITAIVGPNGSGKSNISDAIRWVMGEQSIKSLRGSKMEDIIFAGTAKRKALGFAEVTLFLDNSENFFDIDFPEVQVTRRIYRSGESEYYINKTLCRLKDIHEIFMDTGLGRDGYSIVGQGQIDSILSTKSEDRRQIFEEASGISKYKYRKNEAEKKLAQTTDNLTRVEDILSELELQLEPLKKQSEKAKKYLILQGELKELEINVSVINIEKKRELLEKLKSDIDVYSSQIDTIQKEIDQNDEKINYMYSDAEKTEHLIEECRTADRELLETVNELNNKINLLIQDAKHSNETVERLSNEIDENNKNSDELEKNCERLKETLASLNSQNEAISKSSKDIDVSAKQLDLDVNQKSKKIEEIRNQIIDKNTVIQNDKSSIENQNILIDNFKSRFSIINDELNSKDDGKRNLNQRLDKLNTDIKNKETEIEKIKQETNVLEKDYGTKTGKIQNLISEKNQNNIKMGQLSSRKKTLSDMERDMEGYSRGVKGIMNAYNGNMIGNIQIHGPLSQLIKVEKDYIVAIETALGSVAQNIVTDTPEDAKTAIKYLKQNNLGRATFLPISSIKPRNFNNSSAAQYKGYVGTADSLVKCDPAYDKIINNILSSTVIADTIDNAVEMGKKSGNRFKIVTLGGDVIQAGGAMTGGSVARSIGTLSRVSEIETLSEKTKNLQVEIDEKNNTIQVLSNETSQLMNNIKNNNETLSSFSEDCIKMRSERTHVSEIIRSADKDMEHLKQESTQISEKLKELNSEISVRKENIEKLSIDVKKLEEFEAAEQRMFAELSGKNEEMTNAILELNIRKNSVLKDIEQANNDLQRINNDRSALFNSNKNKFDEMELTKKKISELQKEKETCEKNISKSKSQMGGTKTKLNDLVTRKQEIEKNIKESQASVKVTQESLFKLSGQHAKAQSKHENLENELEAIINHLWEEYELTYNEISQNRDLSGFNYSDGTKRISELRKLIKELGNINIDSIEEYKTVRERVDFLTEQTNDLEKSKKELGKIIDEMLEIMKSRFSEQFKIINENFSRVFAELFGGGQANLSLIDPNNVLESGIEIEAQPPGKKLQSLTLLSGGERAFTAIALLFAILNVRPTPFCILDEIEAALDDVNVYRYAEYLKQYSQKTQFIVVTHRRGTMEAANILYGVTMQEKGVSKLLTLNIDEVQE